MLLFVQNGEKVRRKMKILCS